MSESKPPLPKHAATFASARSPGPGPSRGDGIRQRGGPQRQTSPQNLNSSLSPPPGLDRRRSSILSYSSIDGVAQSLAGDLLSPSTSRASVEARELDEVTHWHSTPLAFAILPAVGGLLFKNGSAFVTDILLLGLAAIFMNWSIRLPWDWYYSAQVQRRAVDQDDLPILDEMDQLDELDETAVETGSSTGNSPKHEPNDQQPKPDLDDSTPSDAKKDEAAAELRRQEKLALLSTFGFPVLAAYLIHVIRGQLSTSSTGLVSDFNLSIFLLAAEIRPCRQLVRLITNRTLHLQRTATGLDDPFAPSSTSRTALSALTTRLAEIEAQLSDHTILPQAQAGAFAQKGDVADLSAELRKRYEPRIEGLERAMRRYEKRSALLATQIDQRLGQMDGLLQDTLSLAAQAARQSQRGVVVKGLEGASAFITMPVRVAWGVVMWPIGMADVVYNRVWGWLGGGGEGAKRPVVVSPSVRDEKGKMPVRKQVR